MSIKFNRESIVLFNHLGRTRIAKVIGVNGDIRLARFLGTDETITFHYMRPDVSLAENVPFTFNGTTRTAQTIIRFFELDDSVTLGTLRIIVRTHLADLDTAAQSRLVTSIVRQLEAARQGEPA